MSRTTFRKVITSEETIRNINKNNLYLVEKFIKEKSTRASQTTIKNYKSCANIFFSWNYLYNNNKSFTDIKKLELSDFFSFAAEELKWGSARTNGMKSFLSSLSIFIEKFMDDEYPDFKNIILKTIESSPKEFRREKTILTDSQVLGLLNHLSEISTQEACWLALAVYSGSRFSELLRFTTDILDENHTAFGDLFMETLSPIRTKGRGRGGKMLKKYILKDNFLPYYKQWLLDRKKIMKEKGKEHSFLFIKDDGSPASGGTIRSWIIRMEKYLGINFYPHSTRHFLCTELSRKKIPQPFIQFLFGWSSSEMVNIYSDLTIKDQDWRELENFKL